MSYKYIVRLSGSSNHGFKQAARILAEAAAIYGNRFASESASFGPEARSSTARAEVIISDEAIDCPKIEAVDFLLVMTQEAFDKYIDDLSPEGIVVADSDIEVGEEYSIKNLFRIPFLDTVKIDVEKYSMINIFVLGVFSALSDVVEEKAIRLAVMARAPKLSEENYLSAFKAGIKAGDRLVSGTKG
ncbi:MAG: 2-oxoacid:acceptor oxidoreductase family protein [Candidatus Krumholzibacteriota bacterium]|nr:2-oxoacid:acceptor oxidoreductase family protein [Candidatus Krumholzibacteriota bacterium]